MDDKLTRKSQEALSVAVRKAAANGNPQVDPLHLLAALLEQSDGTAAPLLRAVGVDPALIAKEASDQIDRLPRMHGASTSAPETSRQFLTVINTAAAGPASWRTSTSPPSTFWSASRPTAARPPPCCAGRAPPPTR